MVLPSRGLGLTDFAHILDRGVIHFFCSTGVYLIALWGFWLLERKVSWWPGLTGWSAMVVPAVMSFLFISMREIFDVSSGGLLIKSICDWVSWLLGLGASVWALYRMMPRFSQLKLDIDG